MRVSRGAARPRSSRQPGVQAFSLFREVPVERRERDLALLDDPLDPHAVDALGVEQQRRGGQSALARFGAVLGGRRFGEPHKIAAAALYRDIGMALAGRSALVGVRDRVRTRNASCTPRLVHVSADGVLAAQLLTCSKAICRFPAFSRASLRCTKMACLQGFRDGETRTRTGDTTIFSRVLYQLSYLARSGNRA
jgi:hypothetical protein